ncbi:DNA fragmentation factor subunit beta isoform X2 [Carcharodon carcharias]|uniref:DNA fragmentation factor subunit beta isoform X2 n=1 Tax=Carcharodon carcharias TaxID=13397 RepID=UPI001B7EAF40|nr:DNA fragmentation factor subunit beta isoform X2 [Carcharodon carcharias]
MGFKFKVTSSNTDRKYGIVARDLEELTDKGCQKLQLSREGCRVCLFEDGTEVDAEYFSCLEDNCKLIILEQGQKWEGEIYYCLNKILHEYDDSNDELITTASRMLSEEIKPKKMQLLQCFVENAAENIRAENLEDDQEWFKGLNSRFKTKSDYMRFSCGRRMRNYLTEVKNHAVKLQGDTRIKYCVFVKKIKRQLQQTEFNGCYFDRRANYDRRLCTAEGWFTCQGAFDEDFCSFVHSINPYGSRENRIAFSTWNLDHGVEKKRTIIPTIVKTVTQQNIDDRDVEHFYSLLFTLANLKLVHIVCHKKTKGSHIILNKRPGSEILQHV